MVDGFNVYGYAAGNPVLFVDPEGTLSFAYAGSAKTDLPASIGEPGYISKVDQIPGMPPSRPSIPQTSFEKLKDNLTDFGGKLLGNLQAIPGEGALLGATVGMFKNINSGSVLLSKSLASEAQVAELLSGGGRAIAGAGTNVVLRDTPRLVAEYGGKASEWAKISSSTYKAADGFIVESRAYFNVVTKQIVEFKSKINR